MSASYPKAAYDRDQVGYELVYDCPRPMPWVPNLDCGRGLVSNFIQTPRLNERIFPGSSHHLKVIPHQSTSGPNGGVMNNSICYRDRAAECLLAAQEPCQPYYRNIRLSMAVSWLSLARQDEAMDNLLTTGGPMLLARADEAIEQKSAV